MTVRGGASPDEPDKTLANSARQVTGEIRAAAILDALHDPLVVMAAARDDDGALVDLVVSEANEAACAFIGLPLDRVVGASVTQLQPHYGTDGNLELLAGVLASGEPLTLDDFPLRRNDEPLQVARLDVRAVRWQDGVILTWREVTKRYEVAEELRRSEERLRLALEKTPIGMAVLDLSGNLLEANSELCRLLGRDHVWLSSRNISSILYPGEVARFRRVCQSLVAGRVRSEEVQQRFVTEDGEPVWLSHSIALVRDGDGRPTSFVAQFAPRPSGRPAVISITDDASDAAAVADVRTSVMVVSHLMGPLPALALTTLLSLRSDLSVLPAAGRADLEARLRESPPDVLVVMVAPGLSGAGELSSLLEVIDEAAPSSGVVVVSPNNQRLIQRDLTDRAVPSAFLSVSSVQDDESLARTVKAVADGLSTDPGDESVPALAELTDRELEVLQFMSEGLDNGAIAEAMFVTVKSVESHVSSIFRKLGLNETTGTSKRLKAVLEYLKAQ